MMLYHGRRIQQQDAVLQQAAELLGRLWRGENRGIDYQGQTVCATTTKAYNPDYFQCLFSQWPYLKVGREIQVRVLPMQRGPDGKNLFYALHTKANTAMNFAPHYHFVLSYGRQREVLLEAPRDTYLPPRIYALGPQGKKSDLRLNKDWKFDNFGLHLFIDRRLVSNRDIKHWLDFSRDGFTPEMAALAQEFSSWPTTPQGLRDAWWDLPASHLTPQLMQAYCAFWGGSVLTTLWFDGGSFHPGDYAAPRPRYILRKKYPWPQEQREIGCAQIFSAECRGQTYSVYHQSAVSWIGLLQTLGGVPELLQAPSGKWEVKASSYWLSRNSPDHALGKRWPYEEKQDQGVGFRCMHYE
ncbi:MAG: hypothetical protein J6Y94_03080 [Bacteriovoracaceae bacterium]|nr:hypothetical protein [Bacteriovoracaceae bacterium]